MTTLPLPRSPLRPVEMEVLCPCCQRPHILACDDWHEARSGAYVALAEARFPLCEHCGMQFEVAPIRVVPQKG